MKRNEEWAEKKYDSLFLAAQLVLIFRSCVVKIKHKNHAFLFLRSHSAEPGEVCSTNKFRRLIGALYLCFCPLIQPLTLFPLSLKRTKLKWAKKIMKWNESMFLLPNLIWVFCGWSFYLCPSLIKFEKVFILALEGTRFPSLLTSQTEMVRFYSCGLSLIKSKYASASLSRSR